MADQAKANDSKETAAAAQAVASKLDFSIAGVLGRMRETLSQWVSTFTTIATVIFTGVSLNEFVKAPATANPAVVQEAIGFMLLTILGALIIIFASGWASSLQAAPQEGAFSDPLVDPLRFFPRNTAGGLRAEYNSEVERYMQARKNYRVAVDNGDTAQQAKNLATMQDSTIWIEAHAKNLWAWLDAYRARKSSTGFSGAAIWMFVGAVCVGIGAVNYANDLRLMKSPLPLEVLVQGPKAGLVTLLGTKPTEDDLKKEIAAKQAETPLKDLSALFTCANKLTGKDGQPFEVTVLSVNTAKAPLKYEAQVVPPKTDGCVVKSYKLNDTQAIVSLPPQLPTPQETAAKTATDKPETEGATK